MGKCMKERMHVMIYPVAAVDVVTWTFPSL